jgi:hypothetical protein
MAGRGGKRATPEKRDAAPDVSLDEAVEKPEVGQRSKRARSGPFPLVAGSLAVALLLIGVASYFAATLLGEAVRASARRGAETPSALAATVCADLMHQNYGDLVAHVDPSPAPPAATGPYNANVVTQRLHTLDRENGPVTSCSAAPLEPSQVDAPGVPDRATRLLLTRGRSGTPRPIASVLITRMSPEGAWVIERDSSLLLAT